MRGGKDVSVNFIEEAIKTGNAIGFKKTTEILIGLRKSESTSLFKESLELILNEVMIDFRMTKKQLLGKGGDSRQARRFSYMLLKHYLSIDTSYLVSYFNRSPTSVWDEMSIFRKLDKSNKIDVQVLNRYEDIKKIIDKKLKK